MAITANGTILLLTNKKYVIIQSVCDLAVEEMDLNKFGPLVKLDDPVFIHETVEIYGKAIIGEGVSIWPRVVMRAETSENIIGPYSNIFLMVNFLLIN